MNDFTFPSTESLAEIDARARKMRADAFAAGVRSIWKIARDRKS